MLVFNQQKCSLLCFVLFFAFWRPSLVSAQTAENYMLAVQSQYAVQSVKTRFFSPFVRVKTASSSWTAFLNKAKITEIKSLYPESQLPNLQGLYKVVLRDSVELSAFLKRPEVLSMTPFGQPDLRESFPNDYYDSLGKPMTALQLIRAPQAWQITTGDSSVVVGMVDRGFDFDHEELQGKFARVIQLGNLSSSDHGTGIAGIIAGKTDNGKGLASVGRHTKLAVVVGNYSLVEGLDSLSKIPGIKVINCSWGYCHPGKRLKKRLDTVMKRLQKHGVLVVASAGNGEVQHCRLNDSDKINGYRYPASYSYDNVISVTSVGHKFLIGNKDKKYGYTAWKDCHDNSPLTASPNTHTHNDAVDICAPGYHLRFPQKNNTYQYDGSGTSEAAGYVTGTAALMLAVNPDLTGQQLRAIILNTADDISYISYNERFAGTLGQGRLNAYRAVLTAKCMASDTLQTLDLMIRGGLDDFGDTPYLGANYSFDSPDIWVRHQEDGHVYRQSQSPKSGAQNYVYVRVTNRSCRISSGNERVNLYRFAAEQQHWPNAINLSPHKIGSAKLPKLTPGEEAIVAIPWKLSAKQNDKQLHLVAEIKVNDNEGVSKTSVLVDKVVLDNNLAWKSLIVKP